MKLLAVVLSATAIGSSFLEKQDASQEKVNMPSNVNLQELTKYTLNEGVKPYSIYSEELINQEIDRMVENLIELKQRVKVNSYDKEGYTTDVGGIISEQIKKVFQSFRQLERSLKHIIFQAAVKKSETHFASNEGSETDSEEASNEGSEANSGEDSEADSEADSNDDSAADSSEGSEMHSVVLLANKNMDDRIKNLYNNVMKKIMDLPSHLSPIRQKYLNDAMFKLQASILIVVKSVMDEQSLVDSLLSMSDDELAEGGRGIMKKLPAGHLYDFVRFVQKHKHLFHWTNQEVAGLVLFLMDDARLIAHQIKEAYQHSEDEDDNDGPNLYDPQSLPTNSSFEDYSRGVKQILDLPSKLTPERKHILMRAIKKVRIAIEGVMIDLDENQILVDKLISMKDEELREGLRGMKNKLPSGKLRNFIRYIELHKKYFGWTEPEAVTLTLFFMDDMRIANDYMLGPGNAPQQDKVKVQISI